ncbi:ATP-dependent RNA helicase dbp3 [Golovinomyces cichoracearum]|uniref:RNA helicase n=1 Tax=Golovinomyces cichoracearum TaxID=62708 RepID=A0A420J750_9PEZI|nr:ATP-dependent RNA helicase dbp3 [Golovinomyces cichoracearum]
MSKLKSTHNSSKNSRKDKGQKVEEDSNDDVAKASKRERKEKRRLQKLQKKSKEKANQEESDTAPTLAKDKFDSVNEEPTSEKTSKNCALKSTNSTRNLNKPDGEKEVESQKTSTVPLLGNENSENAESSYMQDPKLTAYSQDTIDAYLAENFISITDPATTKSTLRPIIKFSHLPNTDSTISAHFEKFKSPTPIQAAAWPFLFSGRDVIGVAETGSGKTMAFALPCVKRILSMSAKKRNKGAKATIVSPTRELAMQSYEQISELCKASGIKAVCIYGGVPKDDQRKALKTADIVVATPGRLNDLINEGYADLSKVMYLVLDEADRMLDKGFEEEIKKIINMTPAAGKRQTLMFTATWPESVRSLASTFMKAPVKILIGDNQTGDLRANNRIVQKVEVVDPRSKEFRLLQILKEYQSGSQKDDRIIVFALYKKEATRVEGFIRSKGFRVAGIHGDLSQEQRIRSLDAFKTGKTPILVATDVAARGLDIPSVKLVLNLTFPLTVEDYVHRIGRTGRAGKEGLAITLFTEHDKAQSGALINVLKAAKQEVPEELLKFGTTVKRKEHEAYGAFAKNVDMTVKPKKIKFD